MGCIVKETRKNGTVRFRAEVRREGQRLTKRFRTKTHALDWIGDEEAKIRDGEVIRKYKRRTVAEAIDKYKAEVLPHKKPGTQQFQFTQLAWFRDRIGEVKLHKLTSARLSELREELRIAPIERKDLKTGKSLKGGRSTGALRSARTINSFFQVLMHCLRLACHEWEWLREVPRLKPLKENGPRTSYYTPAEIRAVLAEIERQAAHHLKEENREDRRLSERMNLIIARTALFTGARLHEVCSLRWAHVDLVENVIRFAPENTKTGQPRTVPVAGSLSTDLTIWKEESAALRNLGGFVFPALRPSKSGHRGDFASKVFRKAARAIGISGKTFHDVRHTAATWATTRRTPSRTVQRLLGHSKISTTERYAHVVPDAQREAVRAIEETFVRSEKDFDA